MLFRSVLESGVINAEHVMNVIARLRAELVPPTVATTLELIEARRADRGRYDRLRLQTVDHA